MWLNMCVIPAAVAVCPTSAFSALNAPAVDAECVFHLIFASEAKPENTYIMEI